jgi:hypothetical protein
MEILLQMVEPPEQKFQTLTKRKMLKFNRISTENIFSAGILTLWEPG